MGNNNDIHCSITCRNGQCIVDELFNLGNHGT